MHQKQNFATGFMSREQIRSLLQQALDNNDANLVVDESKLTDDFCAKYALAEGDIFHDYANDEDDRIEAHAVLEAKALKAILTEEEWNMLPDDYRRGVDSEEHSEIFA
jgi:hypothetical protein